MPAWCCRCCVVFLGPSLVRIWVLSFQLALPEVRARSRRRFPSWNGCLSCACKPLVSKGSARFFMGHLLFLRCGLRPSLLSWVQHKQGPMLIREGGGREPKNTCGWGASRSLCRRGCCRRSSRALFSPLRVAFVPCGITSHFRTPRFLPLSRIILCVSRGNSGGMFGRGFTRGLRPCVKAVSFL